MPFSDDEIQAAVEKLVLSTVSRSYDGLGVRSTSETFSQVQEAAAGVFILYPRAPYYCVWLGTQRLRDNLSLLESRLTDVLNAIEEVDRFVLPMTDVSSLFNATSALQALGGAVSSSAPKDITKVPAYQRFDASLTAFLSLAKPAVVGTTSSGADVVMTPDQARAALPSLATAFQAALNDVRTSALLLAGALDDYDSVNLPSLVAQGVVSNATSIIGGHASALDALTPQDRLLQVRAVTLDVIAAKSAVKTFGSFTGSAEFVVLSGTGAPYVDGSHLGTPASLSSTLFQPYVVLSGTNDVLTITVDGLSPFSVTMGASPLGIVSSVIPESTNANTPVGFYVGDGTSPAIGTTTPPTNNQLKVRVQELPSYDITFTIPLTVSGQAGGAPLLRTSDQVAMDMNVVLPTHITAEAYFNPLYFQGSLIGSNASGASMQFDIPAGAGSFGITAVGSLMVLTGGPNSGLWDVVAILSSTSLVALQRSGASAVNGSVSATIGPPLRCLRIRCSAPSMQVPAETTISIVGDTDVSRAGALNLGFIPGSYSACRPRTADDVAGDLSFRSTALTFSSFFTQATANLTFQTTTDPTHLVLTAGGPISVARWDTLVIDLGPNQGSYTVAATSTGTDVSLMSGVPVPYDVRTGAPLTCTGSVGKSGITFASKATTSITSSVALTGTAQPLFFPSPPTTQGTTPWFKLPASSTTAIGDILEFYAGQYNAPSNTFEVTQLDGTLIKVTPDVPVYPASWSFDAGVPPFAKVRVGHQADFASFEEGVLAWASNVPTMASYASTLNRALNPLLVSSNPTAAQVATAKSAYQSVAVLLTNALAAAYSGSPALTLETVLVALSVDPVVSVDTLLKTYKEQGADRATDVLLSGQFKLFFGMDAQDGSYAGTMQKAIAAVGQNDLPVRKSGRASVSNSPLRGSAPSPDYEFDVSDTEGNIKPDAPADFEKGT